MSTDKLLKFCGFVDDKKYIEAVDFACCPKNKLVPRSSFQTQLFGEKHIFLNALKQAIEREDSSWLNQLSEELPWWFIELVENYPEWCKKYRSGFLKAQILCANKAIESPDFHLEGWKKLAVKTGFSMGFVCDSFHYLKGKEIAPIAQKEIPVLLEMGFGAKGQAAHLVIEQVELAIPSEPYPHPVKMSNIPIHEESFQKAIVKAFEYVRSELLKSGEYTEKNLPVFRWWVKPAPDEDEILGLEGPSLYGAFAVGMLSLADQLEISKNTAITCNGDIYGCISEIGGLAQKCQAAHRQDWNIIIAEDQNTKEGDNKIDETHCPPLLPVKTIEKAMEHLKSGIGFELIDYLKLVHERLGKLPLNGVSHDFDTYSIKNVAGENSRTIQDWEKDISDSEKTRRAVIYGEDKVGQIRLLCYEGRKISKESASKFKKGEVDLKNVNIPIFLRCTDLADELKEDQTFDKAIYAALKKEYLLKGQTLSDKFFGLIKEKFVNGQCVLLLDDFSRVKENKKERFIREFERFTVNSKCRILITVLQIAKNKKDGSGALPLEIINQFDEFVLQVPEDNKKKSRDLGY